MSNDGRDPTGQALAVPVEPASGLAPSGVDPSRYYTERYDADSTRIHCSGGWVVAMIERLCNGRHVIMVGDQRYTKRTFATPRAALKWWLERQSAIAMEARQGPDAKQLDGGAATARAEGIAPEQSA